jgi:hypothetical protein
MRLRAHGGMCCGIRHLFEMGGAPYSPYFTAGGNQKGTLRDRMRAILKRLDSEFGVRGANPAQDRAVEVVLTWRQEERWRQALLDEGFQRVYGFRNANTRNRLVVYIRSNNLQKYED